MKKSLLLILASLLAVFALAGCAEDSTNDTPALPPVDPALIEQVKLFAEGYYEISFFYTDGAGFMPFSSNCTTAGDMGLSATECKDATTTGYGQITVDNVSGNITLVTKVQMTNAQMVSLSKDSQYNYTEYPVFPIRSVDMSNMLQGTFTINADKAIKGNTGRDLTKLTSDDNSTYSFSFDTQTGEITNTMTVTTPVVITGITNPITNVTIVMKKVQTLPTGYNMNKNELFPTPVVEGFVANPQ